VVEPVKLPEKSKGGIILTIEGSQNERLEKAGRMIGIILAVGPQCWKAHAAALAHFYDDRASTSEQDPLGPWAKVGDTVLYERHAGKYVFDPMDAEDTKRELYLIHDDSVLARLPDQEDWSLDYSEITV
jgi:co-chaperonin GroES (HSP10)